MSKRLATHNFWMPALIALAFHLQWATAQSVGSSEVAVISYDEHERYHFSEGLCAIQRNQLWGFIDTTGKVVIDFKFRNNSSEAPAFQEGKCCVCLQTEKEELKRMYIDQAGKYLFSNQAFSGITSFSNGIAIVEKSDPAKSSYLQLIDSLGKPLKAAVTPWYSPGMKLEFRGFFEDLAAICDAKSKGWGFINSKGKWAIPPETKYKIVGDFHDGMAFIQETTELKWGAINNKGELVIPFMYAYRPGDFSEGLSAVRNSEDQIGYMDKNGSLVIPYRYEPISNQNGLPFFEGNAIVSRDGFYYSITKDGKESLKIGDSSAEVRMLKNGLIAFKKWTKGAFWGIGLLRTNGEVVMAPEILTQLGEFGNGLAHAQAIIGGIKYNGFVNLDANFVILNENQ